MLLIELKDLLFFSAHGIFEEERITGNQYRVNCRVTLPEREGVIEDIKDTVNYEAIFQIIKERMNTPTPLLETVCQRTGLQIHSSFPQIKSIFISIEKMHPPVEGYRGSFLVSWQREF
ncbi:MAG: dihydroneopterin aldolase [Chitinophagaceae bacterium]|nr:dihydroneopterin aldolase [Chitinophagaceae bacterium]